MPKFKVFPGKTGTSGIRIIVAKRLIGLLALVAAIATLACGGATPAAPASQAQPAPAQPAPAAPAPAAMALSGTIEIDGSSTVFPVSEAVAEEFRKVHPDVRVNVGVSGTGGGFKR